jgi:ABC-type phosphate/phosphonate transport system permease subunit
MNWFRNLSIVKKLILSFTVVAIMGATIFVCALYAVQHMKASNSELNKSAAALDQVTNLTTVFQQVLIATRDTARSTKSDQVQTQVEMRKALSASIPEILDKLKTSVDSPEVKKLVGEYIDNRPQFVAAVEKFEELALAGKRRDAVQLLDEGELKQSSDDLLNRIGSISSAVAEYAKKTNAQAQSTAKTAMWLMCVAAILGTAIGLVAGYVRGWPGQLLVAVIDLMLAFPALLLALMVVALLGPGLRTLGLAVGIAGIPAYARMVRSVVLTMRNALYIEAARSIGAGPGRILVRHLLPGVIAPLLSLATLDVGRAILNVAGLGFLGLGLAPPLAEWGLMLYEGRQYIAAAPWTSALPGLAITLTVLGATLLGDAVAAAGEPQGR